MSVEDKIIEGIENDKNSHYLILILILMSFAIATCVTTAVISFGYMSNAATIEGSVIIMALTVVGGHGMMNAHANGKEHEAKAKRVGFE
mgnify:CR=1 FL=1